MVGLDATWLPAVRVKMAALTRHAIMIGHGGAMCTRGGANFGDDFAMPDFQLFERTPQGEQDITQQHIEQVREARDEYERMIEYLKAQG